jgi:hypothetical protein
MERPRVLPVLLAIAAIAVACASLAAQAVRNASTPQPRQVRVADQRPMLFAPGSEAAVALEFRGDDQMSQQDRDLEAAAESSIGERAGGVGIDFNQRKWKYQQIVCSALPNHLFLRFMRDQGPGDVSVFTASIPRGGSGQVRIIPIQRRGYSLFSPAPINALTISAFNRIRAEEPPGNAPAWLATGLCYAALAGAHPQIGSPEIADVRQLPGAPTGSLVTPLHGNAVIRFRDVAAAPRPMEWTMTFNGSGKLLKATHSPARESKAKVVVRTPSEVHGRLVASSQ